MSEKPKTEVVEVNELIAIRVPKGDRWKLVDFPDMGIHTSIVEALSASSPITAYLPGPTSRMRISNGP